MTIKILCYISINKKKTKTISNTFLFSDYNPIQHPFQLCLITIFSNSSQADHESNCKSMRLATDQENSFQAMLKKYVLI